jgi:hypothetical protein
MGKNEEIKMNKCKKENPRIEKEALELSLVKTSSPE